MAYSLNREQYIIRKTVVTHKKERAIIIAACHANMHMVRIAAVSYRHHCSHHASSLALFAAVVIWRQTDHLLTRVYYESA